MSRFNGLGMGLGNLSRLSNAQTRSISAENSPARRGRAAWRPRAPARDAARELGPGLEGLAEHQRSPPSDDGHAGRDRGPGRDPAHLDDRAPDATGGS